MFSEQKGSERINRDMYGRYTTIKLLGGLTPSTFKDNLQSRHSDNLKAPCFLVNRNYEIILSDRIVHSGLRSATGLTNYANVLIQGRIYLEKGGKKLHFLDFTFIEDDHTEKSNHGVDFVQVDKEAIELITQEKIKEFVKGLGFNL